MISKKQQKTLENKAHYILFEDIELLQYLHPSTKQFKAVLKPDMFVKNNKAAFQQVIYYLLKVLQPNIIHKKIPSWPILDNKMDVQFRKEVMTYINELKTLYPGCKIPTVVTSNLINPGGFKFVNLMLDITKLVKTEILKQEEMVDGLTFPQPKIKKHVSSFTKHLVKATNIINNNTVQQIKEHNEKLKTYQAEADKITADILKNKNDIVILKEKLKELSESKVNSTVYNYDEEIATLETDFIKIKEFQDKFNACKDIFTYLQSNDCYLESDTCEKPQEIKNKRKSLGLLKHVQGEKSNNGDIDLMNESTPNCFDDNDDVDCHKSSLNLLEHFESFNLFCKTQVLDGHRVDQTMVENKMNVLETLLKQYDTLLEKYSVLEEKQKVAMCDLKLFEESRKLQVTQETNDIFTMQVDQASFSLGSTPTIKISHLT